MWLVIAAAAIYLIAYHHGRHKALKGKVEICPRATRPDGTSTGFDCRGSKAIYNNSDVTCEDTHYFTKEGLQHECKL